MKISSPTDILPQRSILYAIVGLFCFALLIVYGPSLSYPFVQWDDGLLIYDNPAVRGITLQNLKTIFTTYDPELYIPLTLLSYQIDYMIGGINPSMYHFTNLVLHLLNSLLVTWLLAVFFQRRSLALFLGAIFALHPLNTEVVIWASARKDLLATSLFLGSILLYLQYCSQPSKKIYYGSIVTFGLGLFSKVTVIGLPFILLLIDWKNARRWSRQLIVEKIPFAALSIAFGVIALFGKTGVLHESSYLEKILVPLKSSIFYIQKFIIPTKLSVLYPITSEVTLSNPLFFIPAIIVVVLLVLGIYSLRKTKALFFGLAWFALCVGPTVLNFSKGDFLYYASDRYAYAGMIGLLFITGTYVSQWVSRVQRKEWIVSSAIGTIVIVGILGSIQATAWEDTESLFQHALGNYPNAAVAHNNLANNLSLQYRQEGKLEEAIALYKKALDISYTYSRNVGDTNPGVSKILSNLASAYRQQGNMVLAKETYDEALLINPVNAHALLGLGILHGQQGEIYIAETYYNAAIDTKPTLVTPYVNLGSLYVQTGRIQEAIDTLEIATLQNPFYPQAHYNLGIALRKLERNREALERFETAVELEPRFVAARINLGILYAERKKIDEAIDQFSAVLQYDPNNARARSALSQLGVQ